MSGGNKYRSDCPIACALEVVGDKWTLVIVRDLAFGEKIYQEFQDSAEKIPSNVLSIKLRGLIRDGVVLKEQYQERPKRYNYRLSDKGLALLPVLNALSNWGIQHIDDTEMNDRVEKLQKIDSIVSYH